jgi:enoyl-CoA hydratase
MPLRTDRHDNVLVLVLDDPKRRNALSDELVAEIVGACESAERDDSVGALVVTGAPPAFCSGAVLGNLAALGNDARDTSHDTGSGLRDIYQGFLRVRDSRLPTVAAVNGPAVGAGFNLALACDVRVAAESARFDTRFLRLGLHPGGGHTWLLERAVGPQAAAAMVLFGEALDGHAAERTGLAWRCVPDDELLDTAVALAARASEVPRDLAAEAKASLREVAFLPSFDDAIRMELERQVRSARGAEFAERVAASRSRRD